MKTIRTISMILGLAACAAGQTDIALLDGPRDGRMWFSPLVVVSDKAPLTPGSAAEAGEQLLVGPLPKPAWFTGRGSGRTSLLRLASPGAAAYRVQFDEFHLPTGARLFFYGLDAAGAVTRVFGPYEAAGPLGTGEFRSGIVPGAVAVIELQDSAGDEWPFHFDWISRIDAQGFAQLGEAVDAGPAESPQNRKPDRPELRPCLVRGQEKQCQVIDQKLVFEGDIIVGDVDEGDPSKDDRGKLARPQSIGISGAQYRWRSGKIPYAILNTLYQPPNNPVVPDARVTAAIQHWNTNLPGLLVSRTNEDGDYILFRRGPVDECSSNAVGRQGGGVQYINISDACTFGSVVHEIGHAAGLWHEHTREDRDDYVTILWENIKPGKASQFTQHIADGDDIGPYDYGSIMHYGRYFFSTGQPTIETIPPGTPIGQRAALSAGDIAGVKKVQCTYALDLANLGATYFGGVYDINVTAPTYCGWTASSDAYWVTPTVGAGTGNGRVRVSVLPNFYANPRTATVTIGGRRVTVTQGPGPH